MSIRGGKTNVAVENKTTNLSYELVKFKNTLLCTLAFHALSPSSQVTDAAGVKFILCRNVLCHEASM